MQRNATQNALQNAKPRTDGQVFLDKEPCSKASHASFTTRKFARVCGRQGKLDKELRSKELRINIFVCVRLVKLVKEKIVNFLSYTRANKTRQGKLVRRTHEQVNSSRKLVKENLPVCTGLKIL